MKMGESITMEDMKSLISRIDGLNALLIAEAALESANSGRLVTIES